MITLADFTELEYKVMKERGCSDDEILAVMVKRYNSVSCMLGKKCITIKDVTLRKDIDFSDTQNNPTAMKIFIGYIAAKFLAIIIILLLII